MNHRLENNIYFAIVAIVSALATVGVVVTMMAYALHWACTLILWVMR